MDRRFVKSQDFVQREVAGECLLVPIRRRLTDVNSLYVLNETGAAVWRKLDGARSIQEIAAELVAEYEVGHPQLEQDLRELVNDLLNIQAIREVAH
jgi:hypothetical protein